MEIDLNRGPLFNGNNQFQTNNALINWNKLKNNNVSSTRVFNYFYLQIVTLGRHEIEP
jgi:hypothetical protein